MASPVRIAIVDPHPLFRTGIVQTIAASGYFQLIGEGETANDACRLVHVLAPELLVFDACLAENGFDAVRDISPRSGSAARSLRCRERHQSRSRPGRRRKPGARAPTRGRDDTHPTASPPTRDYAI